MADQTVVESVSRRPGRATWVLVGVTVALAVASYALSGPGRLGATSLGDVTSRLGGALVAVVIGVLTLRSVTDRESPVVRRVGGGVVGFGLAALMWVGYVLDPRIRGALVSVLIAIGVSVAIFVGANRWLDSLVTRHERFAAITGGVLGALVSTLLVGNRLLGWFVGAGGSTDLSWVLVAVFAALSAGLGLLVARAPTGRPRLLVGTVGGVAIGLVAGLFMRRAAWPAPGVLDVAAWMAGLVVVALLLARLRGRRLAPAAVTGAAAGWFVGAWLAGDLGQGSAAAATVSALVLGALVGVRLGMMGESTVVSRLQVEEKARVAIFLSPALLFIGVTLLVPTIRTVLLSLLDRRAERFVGLDNYVAMFTDPNFVNLSRWTGMFTAAPFAWGTALLVLALVIAARNNRQAEGRLPTVVVVAAAFAAVALLPSLLARAGVVATVGTGLAVAIAVAALASFALLAVHVVSQRGHTGLVGGAGASLGAAVLLLGFAVFAYLRGTFFNNLWWVFAVTILCTAVGLAVAALADRSAGERIAKSIIFMPMAISFVGAAIIWRFMYIARPVVRDQTGVMNALWVWLGQISTTSPQRWVVFAVLALIAVGHVAMAIRGFRSDVPGLAWTGVIGTAVFTWFASRFAGPGIGGFEVTPTGEIVPAAIQFLSVSPYNNFWLMVPFIWIYTGFAMVIFSAAIKGVPADLLEAARVDGATESQMFWRVTVPQIAPTIGVVVTTIMVTVMKVFDIVKVMTNGNFGTQVLANEMWTRAFTQRHFGQGSAIAVILFMLVLPLMYLNIRRMQREVH